MKRILTIALLFICSATLYAQNDVTKFLGIPVDGSKAEMIRKLKEKGFTSKPYEKDVLTGEFNGRNVNIHVLTNNNKVWRIAVCEDGMQDYIAKTQFNNLCYQFDKNPNYISTGEDYSIPDDEDISYEMLIKKKEYAAIFVQRGPEPQNIQDLKSVSFRIFENYGLYSIIIYYDNLHNKALGEDL